MSTNRGEESGTKFGNRTVLLSSSAINFENVPAAKEINL
jgi:hypothetical protein